jgi:hypothetical protein
MGLVQLAINETLRGSNNDAVPWMVHFHNYPLLRILCGLCGGENKGARVIAVPRDLKILTAGHLRHNFHTEQGQAELT